MLYYIKHRVSSGPFWMKLVKTEYHFQMIFHWYCPTDWYQLMRTQEYDALLITNKCIGTFPKHHTHTVPENG